jgi:hypothetical protein
LFHHHDSRAPYELGLILAAGSSDGTISILTYTGGSGAADDSMWESTKIGNAHMIGCNAVSWQVARRKLFIFYNIYHRREIRSHDPKAPISPVSRDTPPEGSFFKRIFGLREKLVLRGKVGTYASFKKLASGRIYHLNHEHTLQVSKLVVQN